MKVKEKKEDKRKGTIRPHSFNLLFWKENSHYLQESEGTGEGGGSRR